MKSTKPSSLRRRMNSSNEGFTLIELLIVIVVLGILAAIVVFALGGVTADAAVTACKADVVTVETAVQAYDATTGGVPVATQSILTNASDPYLQSWPSSSYYTITLVNGAVMVAAPTGSTPVAYAANGECSNAGTSSGGATTTTTASTTTTAAPTTTTVAPTTTTTTASTTTTTSPSNGVSVATSIPEISGYSGQENLNFTNTSSITAMSVTVRIVQNSGMTYNSQFNSFPGGALTQANSTAGGYITYTATLQTGQSIPANYSSGVVGSQWSGTGTTHLTSSDTWTVTTTSGGVTSIRSGTF